VKYKATFLVFCQKLDFPPGDFFLGGRLVVVFAVSVFAKIDSNLN
jgi:hypothetical protein